ncbi:MAG: hypothetical protein VB137_10365 [Burkholderia sp.]
MAERTQEAQSSQAAETEIKGPCGLCTGSGCLETVSKRSIGTFNFRGELLTSGIETTETKERWGGVPFVVEGWGGRVL